MSTPKGDQPSAGDVPVADLSYSAASRELDAIVEFFEQREVDVDQLVARLERATAIVDELDHRIRRTRAQVEDLVPKLEAVSRGSGTDPGVDRPSGPTSTDDADDEDWDDDAVADDDLEEEGEIWDEEDAPARPSSPRATAGDPGEQPLF